MEKRAAFNQVKVLKATSSDYAAVADVDTAMRNETNTTDAAFESTCLKLCLCHASLMHPILKFNDRLLRTDGRTAAFEHHDKQESCEI